VTRVLISSSIVTPSKIMQMLQVATWRALSARCSSMVFVEVCSRTNDQRAGIDPMSSTGNATSSQNEPVLYNQAIKICVNCVKVM